MWTTFVFTVLYIAPMLFPLLYVIIM